MPLPVEIIPRLIDIPLAHRMDLGTAASLLVTALELAPVSQPALDAANTAALTLERYFSGVVAQRRLRSGEDLISPLVCAEEDGAAFSDDEIVSNVILLFVAGHETTSNMIGNAMVSLFRHPDQLGALRRQPHFLPRAVEECMRFDSPVQMVARTAFEDVGVGESTLARGSIVYMLLGAANRDPDQFAHPDRLDLQREGGSPALSLGGGIHFCLGARLASLELEAALGALLDRLPDMQAVGLDALRWHHRHSPRGMRSLTIATNAR